MGARFFVDENDIGLGKRLDEVREDVVYPGHPDLPEVPRQTADDAWLAAIGQKGLVVITRDKRIRYRPVERLAWESNGVRGFVLTGTSSQTTADSVALLEARWDDIDALVDGGQPGPWMYSISGSKITEIELGDA